MNSHALAKHPTSDDVAIIGMACRLPGKSNSPDQFWDFLMAGGDGIVDVPADRWDAQAYFDADRTMPNKMYVTRGGFIEDIDQFDPQFFGISPKEAPHIDPQHRWLLELSYEAFENAGLKLSELKGSDTAVYIGQFMHDYEQIQLDGMARGAMSSHSATGPSMTLTANRISYSFDFTGPSVTLDTACSSSLVALDLACKAILHGDSKLALAGGVNILLRPELTMAICKASMLSPDMQCKSFDASANGYVRSEGAALVLLKRLADARHDGDPILAIIKATGVNQDGQTAGITVPNGQAQQALLQKTLARAGFDRSQIHYAEAHGTGTAVGDPIEVNALGATLGQRPSEIEPCLIGSVKSNIGHTEATAGMAALIKTVLAMQHGIIPKNLHLQQVNPAIDLNALNVRLVSQHTPWPNTHGQSRKAVVNSFGFGGTNANVVLEQAPQASTDHEHNTSSTSSPGSTGAANPSEANTHPALRQRLVLSGKTEQALRDNAARYQAYLQQTPASLADITFSAATAREHLRYRAVLSASDKATMQQVLGVLANGGTAPQLNRGTVQAPIKGRICFVFSGMGTTWAGMGRQLYRREPVFRASIDLIDGALKEYVDWSLSALMWQVEDDNAIHQTWLAQPAIFATQVALAALLASWGIHPACVVGHSAGEVAAAHVAGALSLADAVKVIYHRSRLQHTTEGMGKMLAVGLSETALQPYLAPYLKQGEQGSAMSIAAINSEQAITLSGDANALAKLAAQLDDDGIFARFLQVGVPYHSPVMEHLRQPLQTALQSITPVPAHTALYSTVSGQLSRAGDWDSAYWPENVRAPVLFQRAIENIAQAGFDTFIEVAPHAALGSSISKNLQKMGLPGLVVSTMQRDQDDALMLDQCVASLHIAGIKLDWAKLCSAGAKRVTLPNYAWQHASYWHESPALRQARLLGQNGQSGRNGFLAKSHPLLGSKLNSHTPLWQNEIDLQQLPYLADHQVEQDIVFPGAAYIENALAIGLTIDLTIGLTIAPTIGPTIGHGRNGNTVRLEQIGFLRALFLDRERPLSMECTLDPVTRHYQIRAQTAATAEWELFANGNISRGVDTNAPTRFELAQLRQQLVSQFDKTAFYAHCQKLGLSYQSCFQAVQYVWHDAMCALVQLELPAQLETQYDAYWLHPAMLDGAFQSLFATVNSGYLPVSIGQLDYFQKPPRQCYAYLQTHEKSADKIRGDLSILDQQGRVLVAMRGVEVHATHNSLVESAPLYAYNWQAQALSDTPTPVTPAPARAAAEALIQPDTWLIFADQQGICHGLAQALEAANQSVVLIEAGKAFDQTGPNHFYTSLDTPESVLPILRQFAGQTRGIIYGWAMDSQGNDCRHATLSVLALAQALDQVSWNPGLRLMMLSRGAQAVVQAQSSHEAALMQPAQASLWGLGRVFANEHPEYQLRLIDLDPHPLARLTQTRQLAQEILSHSTEPELALRQHGRYVHRLQRLQEADFKNRIQDPLQFESAKAQPLVKPDASYLITGGLGGLGLTMLQWLARQGAQSIILLGRRAPDALDPATLGQIQHVRAMGVQVTLIQADISLDADVTRVFAQIAQQLPPLAGILHSAGVLQDGTLMQQTRAKFDTVLAPKVLGAWHLHQHSQNLSLDFFVLFSSIAAVVGWPGQSNYAAANAYMDALAQQRQAQGLPALSINWGPWAEAGMAAKLDVRDSERMQQAGMFALESEPALQAMQRLLARRLAQAGVFDLDWSKIFQTTSTPSRVFEHLIGQPTTRADASLPEQLWALTGAARHQALCQAMRLILADVLGLDQPEHIDPASSVFEYGLNSLMGMDFKNRLQARLQTKLPTTLVLKYPTLNAMAQMILETAFQDEQISMVI